MVNTKLLPMRSETADILADRANGTQPVSRLTNDALDNYPSRCTQPWPAP